MLLSSNKQLRFALEAFAFAHGLEKNWASHYFETFTRAGIESVLDLVTGCVDETINMDLEFIGCSDSVLDKDTQMYLLHFLPGPTGLRCFRLAQQVTELVESGEADTTYVHRSEDGKKGDERFHLSGDGWVLHVDCAGFVRSVLSHVTKSMFRVSLSDRSFMRAKDFYRFFETVSLTVLDKQPICTDKKLMKWRIVPDLRMVIPGDVIVWRPKGNAAGHCAFTSNDRKDLSRLLKAVKTTQIWNNETAHAETGLVTRHVGQDPQVKAFVSATKQKLHAVGIFSCTELRAKFVQLNELLKEKQLEPIDDETLQLMKECAETTALNTGHIVFASAPAVRVSENEYRIKVVHSTKSGKTDEHGNSTEGVQEYYRRFQWIESSGRWTRQMKTAPLPEDKNAGDSADDDDVDEDDPEDRDHGPSSYTESEDELAGQTDVEVLAARMCF